MSNVIINTGMQRATELTVSKKVDEVEIAGYPRIYKLGDSFGNFISKTNTELAEMSLDDYNARLEAFKIYVESIEIGLEMNLNDAYRANLTECPI